MAVVPLKVTVAVAHLVPQVAARGMRALQVGYWRAASEREELQVREVAGTVAQAVTEEARIIAVAAAVAQLEIPYWAAAVEDLSVFLERPFQYLVVQVGYEQAIDKP